MQFRRNKKIIIVIPNNARDIYIFKSRVFLQQFYVHRKIQEKYKDPYICLLYFLPLQMHSLSYNQHPAQSDTLAIINEPTLTHLYQGSFLMFHISIGFDKYIRIFIYYKRITQSSITLKILYALYIPWLFILFYL